jgi:phosphoserine phosphatase
LTVKSLGYRTVAISGSVKEAVDLFADMWKIDDVLATELEYDDEGFYTGNVLSTPVHNKDETIRRYLAELGGDARLVIATGDTMSDRGMLRLAEYPIAFNPEQALKLYARAQGLVCVTERKDCITVLGSPGEGQRHIVPRFFSEASLANILPYDVGRVLQKRLYDLGIEHI